MYRNTDRVLTHFESNAEIGFHKKVLVYSFPYPIKMLRKKSLKNLECYSSQHDFRHVGLNYFEKNASKFRGGSIAQLAKQSKKVDVQL